MGGTPQNLLDGFDVRRLMRLKPSSMTGAQLRAWRKAHGWTQVQLAEELGVSRRLVQYYEADKVRIPLIVEKLVSWLPDPEAPPY